MTRVSEYARISTRKFLVGRIFIFRIIIIIIFHLVHFIIQGKDQIGANISNLVPLETTCYLIEDRKLEKLLKRKRQIISNVSVKNLFQLERQSTESSLFVHDPSTCPHEYFSIFLHRLLCSPMIQQR